MLLKKITTVAFTERPAMDSLSKNACTLDILIKTNSNAKAKTTNPNLFSDEQYCFALLDKLRTIDSELLKKFIEYQLSLLTLPSEWLIALDQLIIKNAHVFENKSLLLKAEKTLILAELAFQNLKPSLNTHCIMYNFERVKASLKNMPNTEDQLVYLYNLKAEYLQSNPPAPNPKEVTFDQKIMIEIKKIYELQEGLTILKNKRPAKNRLADNYIDNEEFIIMMKISKRTAQTWRDSGIIAHSQIRNKIYYLLTDVEALLRGNYIGALKK
jgi:hypothetical protein